MGALVAEYILSHGSCPFSCIWTPSQRLPSSWASFPSEEPPFLPFQVSSIDPETARSEPPFGFGFHREGCPAWEPTPSDSFEIETCVGKPPVSCFDWRGLLRDAERKARTKQGVDEVERTAPEREGSRCVQGEWKGSTLDVDVDLDERGRRDHRQNDDERE